MIDGLFIRSLLCAFYFRVFPEIIKDGRLYIAEPPLYRVQDKKNPFVINKEDYIQRYVKAVVKDYKIGWEYEDKEGLVNWMDNNTIRKFLDDTAQYVDEMHTLGDHYKINERLLEMIFEEIAFISDESILVKRINKIDMQRMMNRISGEFPEIYYDYKKNLIVGVIDGRYQLIEINDSLIRRGSEVINLISKWRDGFNCWITLENRKTGSQETLGLLATLKILFKFQPPIEHRFKGLGENDDDDIKKTVMDPNTRTLIRVTIGDIENDTKIFDILRGKSPQDALARKQMMKAYKIPKEMIDT